MMIFRQNPVWWDMDISALEGKSMVATVAVIMNGQNRQNFKHESDQFRFFSET